ncbi:hypothetical protein [Nostoc sp.]|uniref:hypothetical protein n=1 Tax=Nostoc sp. TaxID=1180 RepID=UPI002FF7E2F1
MKKYLLAASLTVLVVNITFAKQTLAGTLAAHPEVTLYATGSLRGALSEVVLLPRNLGFLSEQNLLPLVH